MKGSSSSGYPYISLGLLFLIAAFYFLIVLWTPVSLDDWMFMAQWRETNGERGPGIGSIFNFWSDIRLYDNGRLANTFAPFSSLFSPWKELFPIFTGLLASFTVTLSSVFSFSYMMRIDRRSIKSSLSPFCILVVWAALIFLLPWRNNLFVADYALNYIWSGAITLAFILAVLQAEKSGWGPVKFIFVLFLAFFAGGWHEGFAFSTLAGFLLLTLVRRRKWSAQWYATGIFYAITAILFFFCPGMMTRTSEHLGGSVAGFRLFKLLFDFAPVILLCILIILFYLAGRFRGLIAEAWRNPVFVIGCGAIFIGVLMSLLFTHQARSAFWPDLLAVIMIFILTRPFWVFLKSSAFSSYIALVAFCVCVIPMAYAVTWQNRLYYEDKEIMCEMEKSESGTVFHDVIPASDLPLLTLRMTNHSPWITDYHFHALSQYNGKKYTAVVPKELENLTSLSIGEKLGGSAGAFRIGESIVAPLISDSPETVTFSLTLSDGSEATAPGLLLPFLSKDKDPFTYILVYYFSVSDIKSLSID